MAPTAAAKRELPLANSMRQFDASNCDGRVRERFEPSHRRTASLDRPMILLNDVVEILASPHVQVPPTGVLTPQQPQRATSRDVTVERHLPWDARSVRGMRLTKERFRGIDSTVTAQQKSYRLAVLVDGSVKIVPLGFDRDVRLIDPPRRADESREPVPTLLEPRDVPRHPSKYRRVRDLHAALDHHLHEIPIRQPIRDVPAHAQLDDGGVEGPLAVNRVTGYRLRRSAPLQGQRILLDAPECTRTCSTCSWLQTP